MPYGGKGKGLHLPPVRDALNRSCPQQLQTGRLGKLMKTAFYDRPHLSTVEGHGFE